MVMEGLVAAAAAVCHLSCIVVNLLLLFFYLCPLSSLCWPCTHVGKDEGYTILVYVHAHVHIHAHSYMA